MAAGKEIKRLRTKAGKSAADVALWMGVDAERLRKWESRDADPKDADDRKKVEKYFNTALDRLGELEDFQFYSSQNEDWQPPKNELFDLRASIKILSQELAKLQSKVYNRPVEDCFDDLERNTTLLLRELLKEKS